MFFTSVSVPVLQAPEVVVIAAADQVARLTDVRMLDDAHEEHREGIGEVVVPLGAEVDELLDEFLRALLRKEHLSRFHEVREERQAGTLVLRPGLDAVDLAILLLQLLDERFLVADFLYEEVRIVLVAFPKTECEIISAVDRLQVRHALVDGMRQDIDFHLFPVPGNPRTDDGGVIRALALGDREIDARGDELELRVALIRRFVIEPDPVWMDHLIHRRDDPQEVLPVPRDLVADALALPLDVHRRRELPRPDAPVGFIEQRILTENAARFLSFLDDRLQPHEERVLMEEVADEDGLRVFRPRRNHFAHDPLVEPFAALAGADGVEVLQVVADDELRTVRTVADAAHARVARDGGNPRAVLGDHERGGVPFVLALLERPQIATEERIALQFILDVLEMLPCLRLRLAEEEHEFLLGFPQDRPEDIGKADDRGFRRTPEGKDDEALHAFLFGELKHLVLERGRLVLRIVRKVEMEEPVMTLVPESAA